MRASYILIGASLGLLALALAGAGCSKIPPSRAATRPAAGAPPAAHAPAAAAGAPTAKEAVTAFLTAIQKGDKARYHNSIQTNDPELAEAIFAARSALGRWQEAMEGSYSAASVWREEKRRGWANQFCFALLPDARRVARELRVLEGNGTATAYINDDPKTPLKDGVTLSLVEQDGRWFVDVDSLVSSAVQRGLPAAGAALRNRVVEQCTLAQGAMLRTEPFVGRAGYSATQIMDMVQSEMRVARRAQQPSDSLATPPAEPAPASGGRRTTHARAATPPPPPTDEAALPPADGPPRTYTILPSDTLTKIARKVYGPDKAHRYVDIYNANREQLSNPNQLRAGTVLKIPP